MDTCNYLSLYDNYNHKRQLCEGPKVRTLTINRLWSIEVPIRARSMSIFNIDVGVDFFPIFLKVDVGLGFLNNRDVGVDFDYLTNIALQGKSVRLIVYNIHEGCKKW